MNYLNLQELFGANIFIDRESAEGPRDKDRGSKRFIAAAASSTRTPPPVSPCRSMGIPSSLNDSSRWASISFRTATMKKP